MNSDSDIASIDIAAPADRAFAYVSDPNNLDRWSFGTWRTTIAEDGLVEGQSIFDGSSIWLRIDADRERLLADYHLGASPDDLTPRICARVVPGERLGGSSDTCVLSLIAWRGEAMDDARWRRLKASHAFELELLKSLIEQE